MTTSPKLDILSSSQTIGKPMRRLITSFFVFFGILATAGQPVTLNSTLGLHWLTTAEKPLFWPIIGRLQTQQRLSWCALAADATVLNVLHYQHPASKHYLPRAHVISQHALLQTASQHHWLEPKQVKRHGITLMQNAHLLQQLTQHTQTRIADHSLSIKQFKRDIQSSIRQGQIIIVNYPRQGIGQQGMGHFSPIAAYNAQSQQVLILDVARYRYPPVWIALPTLYHALQAIDPSSGKPRGYLIVSPAHASH